LLNNIKLGATDANRVASQLKEHRDPYSFRRLADVDVLANVRFAPKNEPALREGPGGAVGRLRLPQ
jgi:hypothetical protein